MAHHHLPLYEGDEDPKDISSSVRNSWNVMDVTDEMKKWQFVGALRKRSLTWFMNFIDNQTRSKHKLRIIFYRFSKHKTTNTWPTQKLKEIKQMLGEFVQEYDKWFKDPLSQISYPIDKELLIQWFVVGLLQRIRAPS
jgi:hypothetical protein